MDFRPFSLIVTASGWTNFYRTGLLLAETRSKYMSCSLWNIRWGCDQYYL